MIGRSRWTAALIFLTAATAAAVAPRWQDKVDAWVLDSARAGDAEFLVVLAQQADLGPAATLTTKADKGAFVYRALTEAAARTQGPVIAALQARGAELQPFWVVNMIRVRGDLATVEAMARRSDVMRISANPRVRSALPVDVPGEDLDGPEAVEWNIAKINADDVWATGTTGVGAVVAGQDTGYLWNHPALVNQYRGGPAGNHDYNWHDAIHSGGGSCGADSPFPCDDHGHGTHTMGTIVGDDGGGNQIGVAPGARWIGCRNMDQGVGTPATYAECYQWFIAPTSVAGADPDPSMAPDVINNSWGCPPSEGCTDPNVLLAVVQNVRAAGIVTVHSAGNDGWGGCSTVTDPAAVYDESFSVGATDSSDGIASFSSRGPVTVDGSNRMKPDISAPGVNIRSSTRDGGYQGGWDGTSMAGPHVAGVVALLVSHTPALAGQVNLLEDIMGQTAVPRTTTEGCGGDPPSAVPNNTYGWGRVDAWAAHDFPLDFTLSATPPAVDVCAPASAQIQVEVGQYQTFSEPVTLDVDGTPAGATVDFSANPVVPPGTSQLTIGNTGSVTPGSYPMQVVGTSSPSGLVHQSPVTLGVFSQPAGVVTPTAPPDGAANQPLRPTFVWTEATEAAGYRLQVATDAAFNQLVLDVSDVANAPYSPEVGLQSSTRYFWRVRALNPCGAGSWSPAFDFATEALPGDCGLGTMPELHYQTDFEAGAAGWTHSGSGDTWSLTGARVHSGVSAFHAVDPATTSDQWLISPPVVLPSDGTNMTLQFWNWQEMESSFSGCWDGGLIEISTDGGSSFHPLPDADMLLTDPYDGPIYGLPDREGWCGDPQDWLKSVVDIGAYAGQSVRFGFRLGSDTSVGREGWYVDDVVVQVCVPGGLPFADGFESGWTDGWSGTIQ